ncbi:hypothetical protein TNCV_2279671 [Trichonephila clavipes]|uniref:Uncharacterized protein n=1 Tax=Trichonephila clavipes TaxID=2585209 RepID=A0A8X6V0C8_TRICX|nr:hypothetical protein TNCV_2279671 [Trichonephila clavipes]
MQASPHTGDILRLKTFSYDVCMVRTRNVIHKHKFCAHGAPKQTYMLFYNDVPIYLTSHGSYLNMLPNSGIQRASYDVKSTRIPAIIIESLPKPGDDTLGDSKSVGYF